MAGRNIGDRDDREIIIGGGRWRGGVDGRNAENVQGGCNVDLGFRNPLIELPASSLSSISSLNEEKSRRSHELVVVNGERSCQRGKNGDNDERIDGLLGVEKEWSEKIVDRYVTRRRATEGATGKPSTVCDGSLTDTNRGGRKTICVGAILTLVLAFALTWLCSPEIVTV